MHLYFIWPVLNLIVHNIKMQTTYTNFDVELPFNL